jgi:uncharacterized protein (DUF58 family)
MDAFLAFLIVLTLGIFLFVILPHLLSSDLSVHPRPYVQRTVATTSPYDAALEQERLERQASQAMLNNYYQPAAPTVPVDYPRKAIGACPYSKPPSTDLPIVNTPMCVSVTDRRRFKDMSM